MNAANKSRGQAAVEFALAMPALLLIVFGIVDFGRAVWAYNSVAYLARDGARYGTVPSHGTSAIQTYAAGRCTTMLTDTCGFTAPPAANAAAISVTRGTCGSTAAPVVITVSFEFQAATPMIANLWGGGTLPLQATSQMYVEAAPPGGCAA